MADLHLCPWFRYGFTGDEVELELRYPQAPWTLADGGEGGSATAASGIPEAYRIREDRIARLQLRVYEDELPAFRAFLRWARMSGEAFTFRFDVDEAATEYEVYLHAPRWEDQQEVEYHRDPEFPSLLRFQMAIRTEMGDPINISWTDYAVEPEEES